MRLQPARIDTIAKAGATSGSYAPALERLATCRWPPRGLAGEASAVKLEAVGGAENGDGYAVGLEELVGEGLELIASDGFDGGEVEGVSGEAVEGVGGNADDLAAFDEAGSVVHHALFRSYG